MPDEIEPDRVVYARYDDLELTLSVFGSGPRETPARAMLFIHGGGWTGGKPEQFFWHARALASQGWVAASIRYRLKKEAPFPAPIEDARAALHSMRDHADLWGLDPKRIAVMGSSAGGHLVACLGVNQPVEQRPAAVVGVCGLYDAIDPGPRWDGRLHEIMGHDLRASSPFHHIDAQSPPHLLLHDPEDPTVPYEHSRRMHEGLTRLGVSSTLIDLPGAGHGFIYSPVHNPHAAKAWIQIVEWLDKTMPAA